MSFSFSFAFLSLFYSLFLFSHSSALLLCIITSPSIPLSIDGSQVGSWAACRPLQGAASQGDGGCQTFRTRPPPPAGSIVIYRGRRYRYHHQSAASGRGGSTKPRHSRQLVGCLPSQWGRVSAAIGMVPSSLLTCFTNIWSFKPKAQPPFLALFGGLVGLALYLRFSFEFPCYVQIGLLW